MQPIFGKRPEVNDTGLQLGRNSLPDFSVALQDDGVVGRVDFAVFQVAFGPHRVTRAF